MEHLSGRQLGRQRVRLLDLFPTYASGGNTTTIGGVTEPNVAVYPAASGSTPYPSGVAGTPGPLDGYCSSLGANPETGTNVNQPANTNLPMAPYYFPDIVLNSDGSLTGYFDWRPKDGDEAITVAKSTGLPAPDTGTVDASGNTVSGTSTIQS